MERGLEKIDTAMTVGFSHAQVETLDDAAGVELAGLEAVHQQVLVVAQRADELLHGGEFAAHGAGAPFPQKPTGPARTVVLPEGVEGFLESEGADGFEVVSEQVAQLGGLADGEVAAALEAVDFIE
jgi:hypothetical protein